MAIDKAIAMTVAMAIDNASADATAVVIVHLYQKEKNLKLKLKLYHIYKLDNICTLTGIGEYREIPAFGLGSSLGLHPWELPRPHAGIFSLRSS